MRKSGNSSTSDANFRLTIWKIRMKNHLVHHELRDERLRRARWVGAVVGGPTVYKVLNFGLAWAKDQTPSYHALIFQFQ